MIFIAPWAVGFLAFSLYPIISTFYYSFTEYNKGRAVFRTLYYLPALVPPVASALIWVWLLNPQYGLVNALLRMLHLSEPLWFSSAEWSKPAIILMMLWGIGDTMVVYLAGIGEIPRSYYEAMELDGGGSWHKFTKKIWPMLTPVTLFQLISGIINGFNLFTQAYVVSLTRGRLPGDTCCGSCRLRRS